MPTPNEGLAALVRIVYNRDDTDFTGAQLGLLINPADDEDEDYLDPDTAVLADVLEPSGGEYARRSIPLTGWTVDGGNVSRPLERFIAGVGGYSANATGAFIATTGATPRLLHFVYFDEPVDMSENGNALDIDLATLLED